VADVGDTIAVEQPQSDQCVRLRARTLQASNHHKEIAMATTKKPTARGLQQDRRLVAGSQKHEVRYESEKTGQPQGAVRAAVKSAGNSRKAVEKKLSK
jgi:hypothetical protein